MIFTKKGNAKGRKKFSTDVVKLKENDDLIDCFDIRSMMILTYPKKVIIYDTTTNLIIYQFSLPFTIKLSQNISDEVLIFISEKNIIYYYSLFGNLLFSTLDSSDDNEGFVPIDYSNLTSFDNILITVTKTGYYQVWDLWKEAVQNQFNFRSINSYILHRNNEIMLYSPMGDSPLSPDIFPIIKLPTESLNNNISKIRINGNRKLLAIYVSNKKNLLLYNMETSVWLNYPDLIVIDMQWLASNYLILNLKSDDGTHSLKCVRIPLQHAEGKEFNDLVIWEYFVPESRHIMSFHINTLSKFKPLRFKNQRADKLEKMAGHYFKTGELIVITEENVIVFDAISIIEPGGINILKKFFQYLKIDILKNGLIGEVEWALSYKDGVLLYTRKSMIKLVQINDGHWQTIELLKNVERIIDILRNEIYLVKDNKYMVFDLDNLWNDEKEQLSVGLEDEGYPISVAPESAIIHYLHCIFSDRVSRLIVKHDIYLDKLIVAKIEDGASTDEITSEYHTLKHYKFALEKILSSNILDSKDLTEILKLVTSCHTSIEQAIKHPYSDMLEIISNCLRKIEIKYWKILFDNLNMTPRDLLNLCIEANEAKILGVLLLVFLNFNEGDLRNNFQMETESVDEASKETKLENIMEQKEEDCTDNIIPDVDKDKPTDSSNKDISQVLSDEELMLKVLGVLVSSASSAPDPIHASDAWDMCFQLVRFLKELDKQNNSSLVGKAIESI